MRALALAPLLPLLAAACVDCPELPGQGCLGYVRGACVQLDPDDPPAVPAAELGPRLLRGVDAGAALWSANPAAVLAGYTIVLREHAFALDGVDSLAAVDRACLQLQLSDGRAPWSGCIEYSLPHELGHVVLGDHDHTDPRWAEVDALAAAMCAEPLQ